MKALDLSIIIVNWNTRDLLADCLASVAAHPPTRAHEIIVVDNASADGSADMVRERYPSVRLLALTQNLGFASGNNRAMELSHGRFLLFLNPDTVLYPGAVDALVAFMEDHPEAGAAGSMLLNADGTLQTSCFPAPTLGRELWRLFHFDALRPIGVYPMQQWPTDAPRQVDTVQGASFIVRREVLAEVGKLDESFFMYSEEVDWCLRIREAGWSIHWVPASRVVHYGGQSSRQVAPRMFVQLYHSKLLFFRKHYGRLYGLIYKAVLFTASLVRLLFTPLAWLLRPDRRPEYATLARRYGRLLLALPGM